MTILKHKKVKRKPRKIKRKRTNPKKNLRRKYGMPITVRKENEYVVIKPVERKQIKIRERVKQKLLQLKRIKIKPEEKKDLEGDKREEARKMMRKKLTRMPITVRKENEYTMIKPVEKKEKKEELKQKPTKPEKIGVKFEKKKDLEGDKREEARKMMRKKLTKIPINMIETDIDKLMIIIEEKKSVSVKDLSKALNVEVERIENWAKILEKHGLIEIEYPIIGLPRLRKKEWKEKS